MTTLTVSQLNSYIKSRLESDENLTCVYVSGEISGFTKAASGHAYFSLKDTESSIRCVIFAGQMARVKFDLSSGMHVLCAGYVSSYVRSGEYQLYVQSIRPEGVGEQALLYEQLKQKLMSEGLFDPMKKRPLPTFPKKVGVITSASGAAVQDVKNILSRRYPLCEMVLFPSLVQGSEAAKSLVSQLSRAYADSTLDVLILTRGGGSAEDLFIFNDETLVRTVAASPIPIVSAVGHEIDVTLCDFAADLRAPTPSAAAELVVPDREELLTQLVNLQNRMRLCLDRRLDFDAERLDRAARSKVLIGADGLVEREQNRIETAKTALCHAFEKKTEMLLSQTREMASRLDVLSPLKTLSRGYAVASKDDGTVIRSTDDVGKGEAIDLRVMNGNIRCKVE